MKFHLFPFLWLLSVVGYLSAAQNLICYYDSLSFYRHGLGQMWKHHLRPALDVCTHLVYGYAGISARSYELSDLYVDLNVFRYRQFLYQKFPHLKFLLSVGGDHDVDEAYPNKYIELLEASNAAQQKFIDRSISQLKRSGFDGLDLAFQFPKNNQRNVHEPPGDFVVDPQAEQHKTQFTNLVGNLKNAFRSANLTLSLTVLPNVNSSWYFDVRKLHPQVDFINLAAFDFLTPLRNPEEADYTAPIFFQDEQNRLPYLNVDFQVNYWLQNDCPPNKLNLGIATYGRGWKMTSDSGESGIPVVSRTYGPAPGGLFNASLGLARWPEMPGMFTWPDICEKLAKNSSTPLRQVTDLTQKYGNYALRPANEEGEHGMWLSFDGPHFAGIKAAYAKDRNLGGMAIFDLTCDDFRGLCTGKKFPILQAIKDVMG